MASWRFPYSDIVERLFGRGIEDAQGLVSPGTVQPVVLFDDLSDRAPSHQNPIFSGRSSAGAQAGLVSANVLQATTRPIRLLYLHGVTGSAYMMARLVDPITANLATSEVEPLGPKIEAATAALTEGTIGATTTAAAQLDQGTWVPMGMVFDPGTFFVCLATGQNAAVRVDMVWEELPVPD